jgi:hypothetical protein
LCAFSCAGAVVVCARGWSRAVDSICHDAWSSWIAGGFMKSSALGRARAAATCADDGPLSLGLLSWLCVACGAARGTREGLAARRMRDRLRYHAGSPVRRGQPLRAEVLLAVPCRRGAQALTEARSHTRGGRQVRPKSGAAVRCGHVMYNVPSADRTSHAALRTHGAALPRALRSSPRELQYPLRH